LRDYIKINAHGHLLPYPDQIPSFMKDKEVFWIDKKGRYMKQKGWKRPITDASFFLNEKLEWMERNEIDHEVILNLSQLYCNGMKRKLCKKVIQFQNDFNALTQANNPKKITSGFVVQAAHMKDALKEIERCVHQLNLRLLCLPTHFQTKKGVWRSIAHKDVEPIFELANELKLAVEIHPYDAPKMIQLEDEYWRFHLVWMCAQTADAYHMFTLLGYHNKYPNMRTCFAHGNQFGQINIGRRMQGFLGRPDLFKGAKNPRNALGAKNIYFDTLVHDVDSLALLVKRSGVSQILAGLDDPYPLGEMESVPNSYPGLVIDCGVDNNVITDEDRKYIWGRNVLSWLGKEKI